MSVEAFPLHWPLGWPRTEPDDRKRAIFKCTFDVARNNITWNLSKMMGMANIVISTMRFTRCPRKAPPIN